MKNNYITLLLCALTLTLSGCLSDMLKPEKDPTVFYILKEVPAKAKSDVVLNVNLSSISLPSYIDKTQIVSYTEANKILVSEFNRWGEPLSNAVTRTVYLDMINTLADGSTIYTYPLSAFDKNLPSLSISIFELAGNINGESKIKAIWSLGDAKTDKLLAEGSFEKTIANGKHYAGYVNSFSQLLSDLSVDIIAKISKLSLEK